MVLRLELTYSEFADILDTKITGAKTTGFTLKPGLNESGDLKMISKSLLPNEVKMNITIDVIRLRSNSTTSKTIKFTAKISFFTILGLRNHTRAL